MAITDPHLEIPNHAFQWRSAKVRDDLNRMTGRSRIHAWLFAGDFVGSASPAETGPAQAWVNSIETGDAPRALVPGNHDLIGMQSSPTAPYLVPPRQWAEEWGAFGATQRDWLVDVGRDLRVLCLAPADVVPAVGASWRLTLSPETLAWCSARAAETSRRCVVLFHAPLKDTVNAPDDGIHPSSAVGGWYAEDTPQARIADMLAANANIIAWVSGHTHSPPHVGGVVASRTYGRTRIAAVSSGGTFLISDRNAPVSTSACLSVFDTRVEVRYRDHGRARWLPQVHTVALA
jgi:hypothetical protein